MAVVGAMMASLIGCTVVYQSDPGKVILPDNWSSVEDVMEWTARNIIYVADADDVWQSPEQTMLRRAGDCEDVSILAMSMLRDLGFDPTLEIGTDPKKRLTHAWVLVDGQHWEPQLGVMMGQYAEIYTEGRETYSWSEVLYLSAWEK